MNEKLQTLKDSIDHVFASNTFIEYQNLKQQLDSDAQYQMYKYILNNKTKFSANVYNRAKLKYVNKESRLKTHRQELDDVFNQLLKLYDKY